MVGWQLASHMRTDLVLDALRMALGTREHGADFRLVAHTDRGSQYTSAAYTQVLDDHHVLASVGSVGDAYDNALAESFVDSFKTELIADRVWRTRAQLELAVVEYISLVQPRPPARVPRRHPARRVRDSQRQVDRDTRSMNNNQNLETQSPWNPVRLRPGRRRRS